MTHSRHSRDETAYMASAKCLPPVATREACRAIEAGAAQSGNFAGLQEKSSSGHRHAEFGREFGPPGKPTFVCVAQGRRSARLAHGFASSKGLHTSPECCGG